MVLLPELVLAVGAMVLLLIGAVGGEKTAPAISFGAIAWFIAAGAEAIWAVPSHATAFHGAFVADDFARFTKVLILVGAALCILLADEFFAPIAMSRFELPVLMVLCGAVFAAFFARLAWMQFGRADYYADKAAEASSASYTVPQHAARGAIVDSAGVVLARDTTVYDVYLRIPAPPKPKD